MNITNSKSNTTRVDMIKKRHAINLNILVILSLFSLLFFVFSCNQITENKYEGNWILKDHNYTAKITLKDGNYSKEYSSDDLKVPSSGKFYLNKNENRVGVTLSFIPDKIITENDTIFQECENLDVIEINDSSLIIQKSNQFSRDAKDKLIKVNEILIYKKQ
ncbi:hypothetical protein [Flavobacterium reichenbachii]|uniref:Lipocalin-like domain-containing protein n=1 Tax=Flavobacterium reichenbachii TaxID=362418 RepID=A0A085ZEQ0_9FLAO|nr:hypothetical protein [Flavobacterium reichenbachii]KFF02914.1 hypothetical protein IW19_22420 [Flavobacterium reichenbachii]OXB16905.1 hypothetical protein B0A68_05595 [Flavobacterium reichenbachii]